MALIYFEGSDADSLLSGLPASLLPDETSGFRWAWRNYDLLVRELIASRGAKNVIEIGGGRSPSLPLEYVQKLGIDYVSNDISARELSLGPPWVGRAHFDISSPMDTSIRAFDGKFNLAFSKMVMEHVNSYEHTYRNLYNILAPGGISVAFHPVLYSFPFILNRIMPADLSASFLKAILPNRSEEGTPKFPARYSGCVVSSDIRNKLLQIGFTKVAQIGFFGHNYYDKIPIAKQLGDLSTSIATKIRQPAFCTFSITMVGK